MSEKISMETTVSAREAYLAMYDFLDKYWQQRGKPEEIGVLLGALSLWDSEKGKVPMDAAVFSSWLDSIRSVLELGDGYDHANIRLM